MEGVAGRRALGGGDYALPQSLFGAAPQTGKETSTERELKD